MLRPLPHAQAEIGGAFWNARLRTNREMSLPANHDQCRRTGRFDSFRLQWKTGQPNRPHQFWDSDVAKWLEAACYSLQTHPDAKLARQVEQAVDLIVGAQQPDGYLNTFFTVVQPENRWKNLRDMHELYCAGHLIEAAVAHHQATGSRKLLDCLCRYADHIGRTFGRGKGQRRGYCGHPEIELALVKLYRATSQKRYLQLAEYFINERGRQPHYYNAETLARTGQPANPAHAAEQYLAQQCHLPVRQQKDAVGHAVRAMYLFCGMADVAAETGDRSLITACRRLWQSVTERRMYVIGGIGSSTHHEAFTHDYDLSNEAAYAETCAAIGLVFFAQRMLNMGLDGRYGDVMERSLYNGVLCGVSLDGKQFFYVNPLSVAPAGLPAMRHATHASPTRLDWFGCACCPPNVTRLLASLGSYAYSQGPRMLAVNLYAQGRVRAQVAGADVRIEQRTDYPWDGRVRLTVQTDQPVKFTLALRLPAWCTAPRLAVNGKSTSLARVAKRGYAHLARTWQSGDVVQLDLPMPVQRIRAHSNVSAAAGRVALMRGPLVYCVEQVDNRAHLDNLSLPAQARLVARRDTRTLGGMVVLRGTARRRTSQPTTGHLYQAVRSPASVNAVKITAVPYCLWGNRQPGEMMVWIREG